MGAIAGSAAARVANGGIERRDLEAREARDRLAVLLNMQPGDLRRIGAGEAQAMIKAIEAARAERRAGRL